ncbi:MAG TPA: F0F1 ATP synthase subunit epsilon [Gammaproteobacteria bacterium]|nr:F0F1 ATP synthase subunit epsilon [Gammaproteobacteria bacterium]
MATETNTIRVDIVSAEREIFAGEAEAVFAPAQLGEVGIMPGHAAMLAQLRPGEVRVQLKGGEQQAFYVSGGMLEVQPRNVTVLSDTAVRAHDLDEAAVLKAKQEAEDALKDRSGKIDFAKAQAELAELAAQLQTIQRLRRRSGG